MRDEKGRGAAPESNGRAAGLKAMMALAVLTSLLCASAATGGESSRGGTFLPLGWDARGEALGGAATLLSRDAGAAYWNPANLVFVRSTTFSANVFRPVEGLDNLYSTGTVAAGLMDTRVSPDGTVRMRRLALAVSVSHLGLELAGGSAWNEGTAGLAAGFSFNHWNSIGGSVRLLRSWSDLEDADSWGVAYDLGYSTRISRHLWAGVMMRNLGCVIHYPEADEELDSSLTIALSLEDLFGRISIEGDVMMTGGETDRILAGGQLALVRDAFYLMGGVDSRLRNHSRNIKHFGVMLRMAGTDIAVSFGFDPEDAFGRQTRVSISHSL